MKKIVFLLVMSVLSLSCGDKKKENSKKTTTETETKSFDDSDYVLDDSYPLGDVRRYGIFPDSSFTARHPFSKEPKMKTVLDLAEEHGIELYFPEGFYRRALILDSRQNLKLRFDNAAFNIIHITKDKKDEEEGIAPKNIVLKGKIISYDRLGMTHAENISIDTVYIKSDLKKNKRRSRGCHIYAGCKNIDIKYLEVEDFGSGDVTYQYNHAALAIDGWQNNPENVQIDKVYIKSTDRHGIYLTGRDHLIGEVIIDKFGVGNSKDMAPMQDAKKGEEKDFKALWVNRCYDSFIEKITINEQDSKGKYTAHFDSGDKTQPVTIGTFKVINDNSNINILEEDVSGVIIENKE